MSHLAADLVLGQMPDANIVIIKEYITQHIEEDITPKSVIKRFELPYNKTQTIFHTKTGETMAEYIRRLRHKNSEKLTEKTVKIT